MPKNAKPFCFDEFLTDFLQDFSRQIEVVKGQTLQNHCVLTSEK